MKKNNNNKKQKQEKNEMKMFDLEKERDLIESMSLEELDTFLYEVDKEHYRFEPVGIEEFIKNEEYLGKILGNGLFPIWERLLKTIYKYKMFSATFEIIMNLPIGAGKSTVGAISLAYEIYKLLALHEPREYYGLLKIDTITFAFFSRTKTLAQDVNWKLMKNMLIHSPFFKREVKVPRRISKFDLSVPLTDKIEIDLGSSSIHALGKAVYGGVLDEANFQNEKSEQAKKSYNELHARVESRFKHQLGRIPGKLFCLSSPALETSFVNERIKLAENYDTSMIINNVPIWIVKKHLPEFKKPETFKVFVGSETRDPMIIEDDKKIDNEMKSNIIFVPKMFYQNFEADLVGQLRNVAGYSTAGSMNLFKSKEHTRKYLTMPLRFKSDVITLDFYDPEDRLENYCDYEYFSNPLHPGALRFIHIDIAKSGDLYGLSCCYSKVNEEVSNKVDELINYKIKKQYFIEWVIGIKAKKKQEIPMQKVVDFLVFLRDIGITIELITADSAGNMSAHTLQELKLQGFNVATLSVDKTRIPYLTFQIAVNRGDVLMPINELLLKELLNLRDDGKKIDHPVWSSKDLADATCGAFWNCFTSERAYNLVNQNIEGVPENSDYYLKEIVNAFENYEKDLRYIF